MESIYRIEYRLNLKCKKEWVMLPLIIVLLIIYEYLAVKYLETISVTMAVITFVIILALFILLVRYDQKWIKRMQEAVEGIKKEYEMMAKYEENGDISKLIIGLDNLKYVMEYPKLEVKGLLIGALLYLISLIPLYMYDPLIYIVAAVAFGFGLVLSARPLVKHVKTVEAEFMEMYSSFMSKN